MQDVLAIAEIGRGTAKVIADTDESPEFRAAGASYLDGAAENVNERLRESRDPAD